MTTEPAPDPRPLLIAAVDQAGRLVDAVTVDDLDHPTPCDDYDVRTLLGHLVAVERRVAHVLRGGAPYDVPSIVTDVSDDGWAAAWADGREMLDAALEEEGVLDRDVQHPAGVFPARAAIFAYVSEYATHGWDLAKALDRRADLAESLAGASLEPVKRFLPAEPRGGRVPFGPVVEVGEDAPPYDRLVGWLGRDPGWRPPGQASRTADGKASR